MAALSVEEALARVLDGVAPLPAETVAVGDAPGRVLVEDIEALRSQPPEAVSAMDGYAVRAADIAQVPAGLALIGEVPAGRPFERMVGSGEAVRIFTGGVLPAGTDTVVIQENTQRRGNAVTISVPAAAGKNVRQKALDFAQGHVVFRRGRRLTDRDLALAAGMNHATLRVHRRPKVAIFGTGDELVPPGTKPSRGQIVYANGFALAALAGREGAEATDLGIVRDDVGDTVAAIERARRMGADILVTTGGASVGDYDLVQQALAQQGMALSFWKIAMRPGRPMMHGTIGAMRVLGLPGNPVSSYVCALLFLVPLIRRLCGRTGLEAPTEQATLGRDLGPNDERADYLRARFETDPEGRLIATPFPIQDSSMMVPLAEADCLVIRAPHAPAAAAGSPCRIVKLDR